MWQMGRGSKDYRFQTDQKEISDKMKRRNKFKLTARGWNCNLWIYLVNFTRPDLAKKSFETLIGKKSNFDSKAEIFYS